MRPVAGNPVTNSPCASRELWQSGGLTSYPGQDSNPRSELTFVRTQFDCLPQVKTQRLQTQKVRAQSLRFGQCDASLLQLRTTLLPHASSKDGRSCYENTITDMIRDNTDWSENGECKVKYQMQSEYWSIVYYSVLRSGSWRT